MRKYVLVLVLSVIAVFALRPVSAFTEMPAVVTLHLRLS